MVLCIGHWRIGLSCEWKAMGTSNGLLISKIRANSARHVRGIIPTPYS